MTASARADSKATDGSDAAVAELLEEFTNRLQTGETPDPESFAAAHPAHAERLRQLLPALRILADLSGSDAAVRSPPAEYAGEAAPVALGDFQIVRELGRGAMGVVYEALQLSLNRRVALKVLPFAATMDPRQLQRFHNEALAAAHLDHPHIVGVYGVGCERGVHFYAMRYVEGHTLAQVIDQLRTLPGQEGATPFDAVVGVRTRTEQRPPHADERINAAASESPATPAAAAETAVGVQTGRLSGSAHFSRPNFRLVAELGAQLAEALDHAHQMGVMHRDIKPSNLMLDGRGKVWITDFGLARFDNCATLTATGDILGTLRYMSPEQAFASHGLVDHRTDIYSLGVTLYELLTLQPAFPGTDRRQILHAIASEEPPSPRSVNRSIPADLETIVLKAMEKSVADRYTTAQAMAADLRCFLEVKPIQARRRSAMQRLRNWGRRHQGVVVTAAAGLMLTLAVVAGALGWVVRDRDARQAEAEVPVRVAIEEAELLLERKKVPEALSAALRAEGLLVHAGGHPLLEPQVQDLLKDLRMLVTLEEIRLNLSSSVKDGKFDFADADEAYRVAFRSYGIGLETLSIDAAAAQIRALRIKGELVGALDCWATVRHESRSPGVRALLDVAHAVDPSEWRFRLWDVVEGRGEGALAELLKLEMTGSLPVLSLNLLVGAVRKAKGNLATVVPLLQRARQRQPEDFWANYSLALALYKSEPPQLNEAIGFYRVAIVLRPESSSAHATLGHALVSTGRLDDAIVEFREAIRLKQDHPGAYCNLGNLLKWQGQFSEALDCFRHGNELSSRNPQWATASVRGIKECERLAQLDLKLPAILSGKAQPRDPAEQMEYANLCQKPHRRLYVSSARLFQQAFVSQPALAADPQTGHRYNGACAAALAGCRQGEDAGQLDDFEQSRWRLQALDWLRADHTLWTKQLDSQTLQSCTRVRQALEYWQKDADLAGLRPLDALAKLPQPEREAWQTLWQDVSSTIDRASRPVPTKPHAP